MLNVKSIYHPRIDINNFVTFNVLPGQTMVIYGPNSTGKSSLLKILSGLIKINIGEIILKQKHAYMGHHIGLNRNLLLGDILKFFKINTNALPKDFIKAPKTPLWEISKGQQQIIGLLILIHSNKPLWLVDEPISNLDLNYQDWWWQNAQKHLSAQGAIVLTSHSIPKIPIIFEQLQLGTTLPDQKLSQVY